MFTVGLPPIKELEPTIKYGVSDSKPRVTLHDDGTVSFYRGVDGWHRWAVADVQAKDIGTHPLECQLAVSLAQKEGAPHPIPDADLEAVFQFARAAGSKVVPPAGVRLAIDSASGHTHAAYGESFGSALWMLMGKLDCSKLPPGFFAAVAELERGDVTAAIHDQETGKVAFILTCTR